MAAEIHIDETMSDHLAKDGAPGALIVFLADAVGGDLIMTEAGYALIFRTEQHGYDVGLTEAFACAVDAGERLLHSDGAVETLRRVGAGIAIAAGLAVVTEIVQQNLTAALSRFRKP